MITLNEIKVCTKTSIPSSLVHLPKSLKKSFVVDKIVPLFSQRHVPFLSPPPLPNPCPLLTTGHWDTLLSNFSEKEWLTNSTFTINLGFSWNVTPDGKTIVWSSVKNPPYYDVLGIEPWISWLCVIASNAISLSTWPRHQHLWPSSFFQALTLTFHMPHCL